MTENSVRQGPWQPSGDVLCPVCLDYIQWRETPLYERVVREGKWREVSLEGITNPAKRADRRNACYIRCPNPAKDTAEHYLPVTYRDHGEPIVVGLVGAQKAGKTHLLATMIHEALRGGLDRYGITVEPADEIRHNLFQTEQIERLLDGLELGGTTEGLTMFAEMLLVRAGKTNRPLVFFDVAGEDFIRNDGGRRARFLLGVSALMFVVDPAQYVPDLRTPGDPTAIVRDANQYLTAALRRIQQLPRVWELPAAIVLTKCDQLRYQHPADVWLRREPPDSGLRCADFLAESADVYAFLAQYDADSTLSLYHRFAKCTLHFVSATGVALDDNRRYPRGVRPARVLQPLVALLAMAGVLSGPEAEKMGI